MTPTKLELQINLYQSKPKKSHVVKVPGHLGQKRIRKSTYEPFKSYGSQNFSCFNIQKKWKKAMDIQFFVYIYFQAVLNTKNSKMVKQALNRN